MVLKSICNDYINETESLLIYQQKDQNKDQRNFHGDSYFIYP